MTDKNKSMTIRLDSDLHKQIKIRVAQKDITLTDYILELVKEDLEIK